MVIDMHVHPVLFGDICSDSDRVKFRKQNFGLYKSSPVSMDDVIAVMDYAKVDKAVLLGQDYSFSMESPIVSNLEIKTLVDLYPTRFIGFASVDPRCGDAVNKLKEAYEEFGLSGLKLNLSHLEMYPDDERLNPLLKLSEEMNKPVIFHAGFSWEPNSPAEFGRPILYEKLAIKYPALRMCLAHLGWPWVEELTMMLLKYPNVYTDTATVYMDSPKNYYEQIFMKNMAPGWLQNCLMDKVMYGSNLPRFRQARTKDGLEALNIRKDVLDKILGENAEVFLGIKERCYDY